jgi:hypothetical protein
MNHRRTLFPPIKELPIMQYSENWQWTSCLSLGTDFWIAEDEDGRKWLVKLRGSFYAFRERTFSSIAQHLKISCQSSTFLKIPSGSEPLLGTRQASQNQLAICLIPEHIHGFCGDECPLRSYTETFSAADDKSAALNDSQIPNALDWARGEMLGYICDMHEPPDRLFTPNHEFVQIDNEMMFTNAHADFWECVWLKSDQDEWSEVGIREAQKLCESVAALSDESIAGATEIPTDYVVEMLWDVPQMANSIRNRAASYLAEIKHIIG